MFDFIKNILGQNPKSDCCSVEIKEVEEDFCKSQSAEK